MSVELVNKKPLRNLTIVLMIIQSFFFLPIILDFLDTQELLTSILIVCINSLFLALWISFFIKVKDKIGTRISFNQKYLIIEKGESKREIEMEKMISIESSLFSSNNNKTTWTITYYLENRKRETLTMYIYSNSSAPKIFQNRLEKIKRVKEGKEIPQKTVFPKNAIRRRKK